MTHRGLNGFTDSRQRCRTRRLGGRSECVYVNQKLLDKQTDTRRKTASTRRRVRGWNDDERKSRKELIIFKLACTNVTISTHDFCHLVVTQYVFVPNNGDTQIMKYSIKHINNNSQLKHT